MCACDFLLCSFSRGVGRRSDGLHISCVFLFLQRIHAEQALQTATARVQSLEQEVGGLSRERERERETHTHAHTHIQRYFRQFHSSFPERCRVVPCGDHGSVLCVRISQLQARAEELLKAQEELQGVKQVFFLCVCEYSP